MREVTGIIKIYTFKEASPELKDKIRDNFANHYDIYVHCMNERMDTLKSVAKVLDATVDYSLSTTPDRGEYIRFTPKYDDINFKALKKLVDTKEDCPLTGVCYDDDFLDALNGIYDDDSLDVACCTFIASIHNEFESMLTDDCLADHCEANGYEFTENGEIY